MKKLFFIIFILLSTQVYANNAGTIYFAGSIVEPPCEIKNINNVLCFRHHQNEVNPKNIYKKTLNDIDANHQLVMLSYY